MRNNLLVIKSKTILLAALLLFATGYSFAQEVPAVSSFRGFTAEQEHGINPNNNANARITSDPEPMAPAPANDTYCSGLLGAYTLTANAACKNGTVNSATTQAGETFGCSVSSGSVWYSFTATQANMYITLHQTSSPLVCGTNYPIVVYPVTAAVAASCPAPGTTPPSGAVGCNAGTPYGAGAGQAVFQNLNLTGLTVGNTYLVQVLLNGCTRYTFCIALGTPSACTTCATSCGPMCGYNSVVSPTVAQVISTCPIYPNAPPMNYGDCRSECWTFTAPNTSAQTQSIIEGYGCVGGNVLSSTFQLYNSTCGGSIQTGNVIGGTLSPLVAGHQYVLCYTWCAACPEDTIWPYVWAPSALPIELLSFDAKSGKQDIDVYWSTASEFNASMYIVERTRNGEDFIEVGRVMAAGNSSSILNYKIKDLKPLEGYNYYRLKEIDIDGKVASGRLAVARFDRMASEIAVVPNPANDLINIRYSADKDSRLLLRVMDTKGSVVLTKNMIAESDGVNFFNMYIATLPEGVYSVQIVSDSQNLNARFIKQ